ncbi:MAG: Maf family protein [Planctomycetota bacterium]
MTGHRLVLASTSRYRRELLERLRVPFETCAPGVDEDALRDPGAGPLEVATALARHKALAVYALRPTAVVIGSDQVCALDEEVLGKPHDTARAVAQLGRLRGRSHRLITAVAIAHAGGVVAFADVATLTMRALHDDEIERYVAQDEPFDCAGSYRIEGQGIALFQRVACEDWTAIVGLPLLVTARALRELGFDVP